MAELLELNDIKLLAKCALTKQVPAKFQKDGAKIDVNEAFRDQIKELTKDFNTFRRHKLDVYEIIQEAADEYLPKEVREVMGSFAEIKTVPLGQKAQFTVKKGRTRAKQFVTQVGLAGLYETFRLDEGTFELGGNAMGGAARVDFERMIHGAEDFNEYMNIIFDGLAFAVYGIIQKALRAALDNVARPAANKVSVNNWDPTAMAKLINTVKAYGTGAIIYATPEFITAMGPDVISSLALNGGSPRVGTTYPTYVPEDISDIHNTGRIHIFRGTPIVELPQSFLDETNTATQLDPQMAYVFPTGGEKVVKLVFEGDTYIDDYKCKDRSLEMNVYKRIGVAILTHHNWGVYQNKGIAQTYTDDSIL